MDTSDKQTRKTKVTKPRVINLPWIFTITGVSLILSIALSYLSNEALSNTNTVVSFLVLLLFIALGVLFDMIGIAATSATEKEFHSMAARKITGSREAVWMTRNAEKVGSICNDVIGDIAGIISGATGALIVASISSGLSAGRVLLISLVITGLISALTIGGKAAGKGVGIAYSKSILIACGKILSVLPLKFDTKR